MTSTVDTHPAPVASGGALFPGIVTTRLAATVEFYLQHFDFRPVQAGDDTTLLARRDGTRLGLLRAGNFGQPAALQTPTRGTGLWLALEVDHLEPLFARVSSAGVEVVAEPEVTPAGARRFVVRDPNGVLVYVAQRAPATADATAANFSTQTQHLHDHNHRHSLHRVPGH